MKLLLSLLIFAIFLFGDNVKVLESKYLLDANHTYTTDDIYAQKSKFSDYSYSDASFGFKQDTLWIYFKLKNTTSKNQSNVIEFLYALHDYIYVMEYSKGKIVDQYLTGDLTKHNTRKIDVNHIVIPYTLKPNEEKEFIFKIDSKSNLSVGVQFLPREDFFISSKFSEMIYAGYYGAAIIMLLYNLFLYFIIKERVYLLYVLSHFFLLLTLLTSNGFSFTLFWPDTPQINNYFMPFVFILTNFFTIIFTLSFLELKRYSVKLYYFFQIIILIDILFFFSTFFVGYTVLENMLNISMITLISLLLTGIYVLVRYKTVSSKFFVLAWSSALIGTLLEELQGLGILEMSSATAYASQIGSFIELILLSTALAYRYNTIFQKLRTTESELRNLNIHLQEKVDEQTKDLKLLIQELHHRVKNNFQVILTFLWAQKKSIKEEKYLKTLEYTIQRIHAISSIHELFNISDTVAINIKTYIEGMIDSFKIQQEKIKYDLTIEKVMLNYNEAVTIGLILNELITNSHKHAFESIDKPCISVKFYQQNNKYIFAYKDNGVGFDTKKVHSSSGLGYDLIYGFAQKNNAEISLSSEYGMELTIIFDKKDERILND